MNVQFLNFIHGLTNTRGGGMVIDDIDAVEGVAYVADHPFGFRISIASLVLNLHGRRNDTLSLSQF